MRNDSITSWINLTSHYELSEESITYAREGVNNFDALFVYLFIIFDRFCSCYCCMTGSEWEKNNNIELLFNKIVSKEKSGT